MKINTNKLNISKKQLVAIAAIAVTGVLLGTAILGNKATKTAEDDGHGHGSHVEAKAHSDGEHHGKTNEDTHDHDKGHADGEHHEGPSKGPHGGKLFTEGDFGLEALLAEDAGEPRLRIWLFSKDKPLPNNAAKVSATIARLTGEKETLSFAPDKDSLLSREVVPEPHAFEISIVAQTANRALHVRDEPGGRKGRT
jgi:cobalt-zinc-cadmium efflux system membrane fusion protein